MTKYIATVLVTAAIVGASTFGIMQVQVGELREENNSLKSLRGEEVTLTTEERQTLQKELDVTKNLLIDSQEEVEQLKKQLADLEAESEKDTEDIKSWNVFGGAEFSSQVTGYLKIVEEPVPFVENGETQENAYLAITAFNDEELRNALQKGMDEGNSVNAQDPKSEEVLFNLGCYIDDAIQGTEYDEGEYIDTETLEALKASSIEAPVDIMLTFGIHPGRGCTCCNLAHLIRLAK